MTINRTTRARRKGQSAVLIALILAILMGMVGMAVDVGNAYAEGRAAQRAANSAALSAVTTIIRGGSDNDVIQSIEASLRSNRIDAYRAGSEAAALGRLAWTGVYLDGSGAAFATVGAASTQDVSKAEAVRVTLDGRIATFFARVVGTNSLPVNALSFACRSAAGTGVYPLAVRETNITGTPDGFYSDPTIGIRNRPWYRLWLKDNSNLNGGFSWLRWGPDNNLANATNTAEAWRGEGNFSELFQEATESPPNTAPIPANQVYQPRILNPDEWLYGNTGLNLGSGYGSGSGKNGAGGNSGVAANLQYHIDNRTILKLPIFINSTGEGINGFYQFERLDSFIMLGYGHEGGQGKGWFVDLVHLGGASDVATLCAAPPRGNIYSLTGLVQFQGQYIQTNENRKPLDIVVVLDVSGSMSKDWAGNPQGDEAYLAAATAQRRITIARQNIQRFIDDVLQVNADPNRSDRMVIVTYSGDMGGSQSGTARNETVAKQNLTRVYPANGLSDAKARDKNELKRLLLTAGAADDYVCSSANCSSADDQYFANLTIGNTPTATGLLRAREVLEQNTNSGRRQVIVLLTDGLANVFSDGELNDDDPRTATPLDCGLGDLNCQAGDTTEAGGGFPSPRPANVAKGVGLDLQLRFPELKIYVIAVSDLFAAAGLPEIADSPGPPYFAIASSASEMNELFADITTDIKNSDCLPMIEPVDFPNDAPRWQNASYPGTVTLLNSSGQVVQEAVIQVGDAGQTFYTFSNVALGDYQVRASLNVRDLNDSTTIRNYSLIEYNLARVPQVGVSVSPNAAAGDLTGSIRRDLTVHLNGQLCVAP